MELGHLRYFVAVAEELHFGRAAQRLNIVQPALSKQIAALERELGVKLFHRTKRRVALTEAGQAFYKDVQVILHRVDKATEKAQLTARGLAGRLDIGFIEPALWSVLPGALLEYRHRYPDVGFPLHGLPSLAQIRRLLDGSLDAAFVRMPLHEEGVTFQVVVREPLLVTLPEGHRSARLAQVDLGQLANEAFVLPPRTSEPGNYDRCIVLCHSHGFSPRIIDEGSPIAIDEMVAMGLGLTFSPASILNVPRRGVVSRPLRPPSVEIELAFRPAEGGAVGHAPGPDRDVDAVVGKRAGGAGAGGVAARVPRPA